MASPHTARFALKIARTYHSHPDHIYAILYYHSHPHMSGFSFHITDANVIIKNCSCDHVCVGDMEREFRQPKLIDQLDYVDESGNKALYRCDLDVYYSELNDQQRSFFVDIVGVDVRYYQQ